MKNWIYYLPFINFACNCVPHSTTKLSPFEIVYWFKPAMPLDLVFLEKDVMPSQNGVSIAKLVQKLHQPGRNGEE